MPQGNGPEDIVRLVELFQFPVPEGNRRAHARLAEIPSPYGDGSASRRSVDAIGEMLSA